ncbi:YphA family membrane protein [Tuberibacillus calidus]|uniref:YphA family membrane protein n=1 Tax=Tuberibacillus calidus TaxID=340097 RepID=UPI00041132A1|nr:hypothetical protein [Tuberibacillus calidus]
MSVLFYWIIWGFWIYCAFLMNKTTCRSRMMFGLLIIIISAGYTFSFDAVTINGAWLLLLVAGYVFYMRRPLWQVFRLCLSNMTVTIVYSLIHIYWLMDPAIFLVIDPWVFSVVLAVFTMFIVKTYHERLVTGIIGIGQGNGLLMLIFYPYENVLGNSEWLNTVAVCVLTMSIWEGLRLLSGKLQATLGKPFHERL